MSLFWRFAAVAGLVGVVATSAAFAGRSAQPLAITSSIDGKKVIPQLSHWITYPNVAPAQVAEVDFLIDGKLRWVEHHAPYVYASDDEHGHLGYLFTSWLAPGPHRLTARVKTTAGLTATDEVAARVVASPAPPSALAGTWTRVVTTHDQTKADPRYGRDNVAPTGRYRLVVDRVGIWELDSVGTGIANAYSVTGNVLRSYAPIQMVPRRPNGDPGSIRRFGHRIDAGGGIDCDESGPFGAYRWVASSDTLTLTAVREPCGQRRVIYEGTWTRVA
jgi:hypothetical protein